MSESAISRDAVIGFIVTEVRPARANPEARRLIMVRPICMNYEGIPDMTDFELAGPDRMWEEEKVLGVIPAAPGVYQVWGDVGDECKELGFEFPGADHPDWEEVRQEMVRQTKGGNPGETQSRA